METLTTNTEDIERAIKTILTAIGENPDRADLIDTPSRIARMYSEIFRGYDESQKPTITTFENTMKADDIVFDTGEYYSMCSHHMMPFFGKYYFAYIPSPNGRILGLSKVARVVGYCSARLQLQENLARDIVTMLREALNDDLRGMAIVLKGTHLCKTMRGVRNNGQMTVSHLSGCFRDDINARNEFYKLIDQQKD